MNDYPELFQVFGDDVARLLLVGEDNDGRFGSSFEEVLEFSTFVVFRTDEFDNLLDGVHRLSGLSNGNIGRSK